MIYGRRASAQRNASRSKGLRHSHMQRFAYPVTLAADEVDGGLVVTCRDLPEAITQGDTFEGAIEAAEGALEAAIEMRIEDGLDIPLPSKAKKGEHLACLPVGSAMKAAVPGHEGTGPQQIRPGATHGPGRKRSSAHTGPQALHQGAYPETRPARAGEAG